MKRFLLLIVALSVGVTLGWANQSGGQASLGEVARRVRAERAKKDLSQIPMFTNDNIPKGVGISTVGQVAPAPGEEGEAAPAAAAAAEGQGAPGEEAEEECDEKCWRDKFAQQREKIATATRELDILQREYNLARTQYYQDPNQAVREQYSANTAGGRELQDLLNRINEKKTEIDQLQRELSTLEDDLRRAGGKPGWAR